MTSASIQPVHVVDNSRCAMKCELCGALHWVPPWFMNCKSCDVGRIFADPPLTEVCASARLLGGVEAVEEVLLGALGWTGICTHSSSVRDLLLVERRGV